MTKAEELLGLADRCEREDGSRALDVEIAEVAAWPVGADEGHNFGNTPDFTTSIDAALTLVPEPGSWEVAASGCASVTVLSGRFLVSDDIERHATGKTPALALCAAALRARAALASDGKAPAKEASAERARSANERTPPSRSRT